MIASWTVAAEAITLPAIPSRRRLHPAHHPAGLLLAEQLPEALRQAAQLQVALPQEDPRPVAHIQEAVRRAALHPAERLLHWI